MLTLPVGAFVATVRLYQTRKEHVRKIDKTIHFLKRELNRKAGNVKQLPSFEIWEYEETIRNHPLSIDLDLCTKQGLFPYLDTTVSVEGWKLFQEQLLQIQYISAKAAQSRIKETLNTKYLTYHLLRKVEMFRSTAIEKISIHSAPSQVDFWQDKKILKMIFPILSIFTPIWLLISTVFSLPFAPLLLLLNFLLFVSYRKQSSRIWKHIQAYSNTIFTFHCAWMRMENGNRSNITKMMREMRRLGDSSAWIISPIPHIFLNVLFLWDLWKVKKYSQWISNYGTDWEKIRDKWISLEALLPIAHFAVLHPNYDFPNLTENRIISASILAHPLLDERSRIGNRLPSMEEGNLMIITGSNMSGKTTYLRSIAVNLILAGMGGPVCGREMDFCNFRIHTLIRSQDSLENGISFFYSEVRRLSEIIKKSDASQDLPILFLDEILKGTNSRERQIATREILHALREKGAIVFLTTHDLEIAETNGANLFHFTELEKDGEMIFDFQLREGISKTTNALRILKKEGIPIRETI